MLRDIFVTIKFQRWRYRNSHKIIIYFEVHIQLLKIIYPVLTNSAVHNPLHIQFPKQTSGTSRYNWMEECHRLADFYIVPDVSNDPSSAPSQSRTHIDTPTQFPP